MSSIPGRSRTGLSLLTIALGCMLALPALGNASSASRSGGTVSFVANPGETNNLTLNVQTFTTTFTIEDTAGITPGAGCQAESATMVSCGESPTLLVASLGDGNDVLKWNGDTRFGDSPAEDVDAGAGDDWVDGSSAGLADILRGGDGNDHLDAGNGADQVFGDAGNDTVLGGNGDDLVSGGGGMDIIHGARRSR